MPVIQGGVPDWLKDGQTLIASGKKPDNSTREPVPADSKPVIPAPEAVTETHPEMVKVDWEKELKELEEKRKDSVRRQFGATDESN